MKRKSLVMTALLTLGLLIATPAMVQNDALLAQAQDPTFIPSPTIILGMTFTPTPIVTPSITPTYSPQVLIVTKREDTLDGACDADCSLREAIESASWGATVRFAESLTGKVRMDVPVWITKSLTIESPHLKSHQIELTGVSSLFVVLEPIQLTLRGFTISNTFGITIETSRGSDVTIENMTFKNNPRGVIINDGTMLIRFSTFENNQDPILNYYALNIVNSTFKDNLGSLGSVLINGYQASLNHITIINTNKKTHSGFIVQLYSTDPAYQGSVQIGNSIIVGAADDTFCTDDSAANAVIDGGGNLVFPTPPISQFEGCDVFPVQDPMLGQYGDNGGATFTFALLPGSPAIGAGNLANCANIDQRGVSRLQGAPCTVGAVEVR